MRPVAVPDVTDRKEESNDEEKNDESDRSRKPLRRRGNAFLGLRSGRGRMFRASRVILAQKRFFIEAQVTRNGAHEAVAKDAAGQLGPIFIFKGLDKTGADARSLGEFLHGNFAQFALALQTFTKISLGHEPEPILDDPSATAQRLTRRALAKKNNSRSLNRTIGGAIQRCQTARKAQRRR